jgi:predicted P-loop ATPase/GTPase
LRITVDAVEADSSPWEVDSHDLDHARKPAVIIAMPEEDPDIVLEKV